MKPSPPVDFRQILGMSPGSVCLLYGRQGVGKTALGLSVVASLARGGERSLVVYSRARFPIERIARVLEEDELSLVTVSTPRSLMEQRNVLGRVELLSGQRPGLLLVDEVTDLYTLLLSSDGFSMSSVREAAFEVNKQLGFLCDFVRSSGAMGLVTCEERESSEFTIPLRRILFYWSDRVFHMSRTPDEHRIVEVTKPTVEQVHEYVVQDGLVAEVWPSDKA